MDQAKPRQGHEGRSEHGSGGETAPAAGAGVQLRARSARASCRWHSPGSPTPPPSGGSAAQAGSL